MLYQYDPTDRPVLWSMRICVFLLAVMALIGAWADGESSEFPGKAGELPVQIGSAPNVQHKSDSLGVKFANKEINGVPVGTGDAVHAAGSNSTGRFVETPTGVTPSASPQKTFYQP